MSETNPTHPAMCACANCRYESDLARLTTPPHPTAPARGEFYGGMYERCVGMHAVQGPALRTVCGDPVNRDWAAVRGVMSAAQYLAHPDACVMCAREARRQQSPTPTGSGEAVATLERWEGTDDAMYEVPGRRLREMSAEIASLTDQLHSAREEAARLGREKIDDSDTIRELREQIAQWEDTWPAVLREVARLADAADDSDQWSEADDSTLLKEFDPFATIRNACDVLAARDAELAGVREGYTSAIESLRMKCDEVQELSDALYAARSGAGKEG